MPLDVDNTRFPPLRVPCSSGTGAGVLQIREGSAPPYQLGPVRAVGAFGHGVVARVADGAGRRQHPIFHNPGGVHRADVLRAMVGIKPMSV